MTTVRRSVISLVISASIAGVVAAQVGLGKFIGELVLTPDESDPNGIIMVLKEDFGFIDKSGLEWLAKRDDKTDGASIPMPAWSLVGGPWDGRYREAAVLHDHYCQNHVRTWQSTHSMFYEAMIANAVPQSKADLMYYAVYAFGPRWGRLSSGVPCGPNCVYTLPRFAIRKMETNNQLITAELKEVDAKITQAEANGKELTVNDLQSIANTKRPNDPFLVSADVTK